MFRIFLFVVLSFLCQNLNAQKKPIDHSVYDGWKSIGEKVINNNGQYIAYTVNPQEGDGVLIVKGLKNNYNFEVQRGYLATFSSDSRFFICKIKPFFKQTREAKIKKKKPEDFPKDSLFILDLESKEVKKIPQVKLFKLPKENEFHFLAYLLEKGTPEVTKKQIVDSISQFNLIEKLADSLQRVSDSLRLKILEAKENGMQVLLSSRKENKISLANGIKNSTEPIEEGSELVLMELQSKAKMSFPLVSEFYFSEKGNELLLETTRKTTDSLVQSLVVLYSTNDNTSDTLLRKFNDVRNYAFDKTGSQVAFVAERDSSIKSLQKHYKLWFYSKGQKQASIKAERGQGGVPYNFTISPDFQNYFSADGKRLFYGLSPIRKTKDTSLVDFETARLDIWNYKDDYLQPQQLVMASRDLKKSQITVLTPNSNQSVVLGNMDDDEVELIKEGNSDVALAVSSKNNRAASQWQGFSYNDAFLVNTLDGSRIKIATRVRGSFNSSPHGKYIYWFDWDIRQYFVWDIVENKKINISSKVSFPLWDEDDDHPDAPPPYGVLGWKEKDEALMVYDKYDIWSLDPKGVKLPVNITRSVGRNSNFEFRYERLDPEEKFVKTGQQIILKAFNTIDKKSGYFTLKLDSGKLADMPLKLSIYPNSFSPLLKAGKSEVYLVQKSSIKESELQWSLDLKEFKPLTNLSLQQTDYNWLDVELVKWTMFDGKQSEGLLFKPENFDPKKKYPVILYFYERDADGLYNYRAPAPSASTINIPYFVSNGYLVFDPNIYYKNGEPGASAYNSVVSAAQHLAKLPWVEASKMAIQGQSWGGYQVAYLVTRTNMFAAAGAGAPVSNMTSAYGGIRWGTGLNRQFQYERTQSRIGANLWNRKDLYIKNSPLFSADKITTPLLIMHNDKDGAVPWYQGIEFFTALKRLGKTTWLLEYNDEDHNLIERRNRKDLSIRLGQFFDHYLKGAPVPTWMSKGVPAIEKGIEWGLELEK